MSVDRCETLPRSSLRAPFLVVRGAELLVDFGLDQAGQVAKRVLPAEIACLDRNHVGNAYLFYVQLRADRNFLQGDSYLDLTGKVRIVEPVRVAEPFARDEFHELASKGVGVAGREVSEGHSVLAAFPGFHLVHGAAVSVRRNPLGQGVGLYESPIELFRSGRKDAGQAYGAGHNVFSQLPSLTSQ